LAPKIGKKTAFFAKTCISTTFLYLILSKTDTEQVLSLLKHIQPLYFFSASLLYLVNAYLSSMRWRLFLLEKQPLKKLFSLYMIGNFFNILLPGLIGGDAVKLYYLYKDTKKMGEAVGSIFMDRFIGFTALIFIGLFALFFGYENLIGTGIEWVIPLMVFGFFITAFLIFGLRLGKRFGKVANFYDYFHTYLKKDKVMAFSFLLSLLIQLVVFMSVYLITVSLGVDVAFIHILIFVPLIVVITSIPISISGLGVREGAFVLLFGIVGIKDETAIAISFGWFLSFALTGLLGLYYYIRYKPEIGKLKH